MEQLQSQLSANPTGCRVKVSPRLAALLDGTVSRESVELLPQAWCLVALQYNKATVSKVFKLLCTSGKIAQCGALVAEAVHQPEEVTVRKSLMLLLRTCCLHAHEEAEAASRPGGSAAMARRLVCAVAQQLTLDETRARPLIELLSEDGAEGATAKNQPFAV